MIHHLKGAQLIPRTIKVWVELRQYLDSGVTVTWLRRIEKLWRDKMDTIKVFSHENGLKCPCRDLTTNDDFWTHFSAAHLTPQSLKRKIR
jgi:hypothetical protein